MIRRAGAPVICRIMWGVNSHAFHRAAPPNRVPSRSRTGSPARAIPILLALAFALALAACSSSGAASTPQITPGTSAAPRTVNIVMRDYGYVPPKVDLVPGETVTLHVINGGLEVHEAVFGDMPAQLAWESAEAPTVSAPPGPTPNIAPPPGFDGLRVVANSGQLVDVVWTVPPDAASSPSGWFVGCHIPGHWAKGMVVPVQFVDQAGNPIASAPSIPAVLPTPSG
jgi:hypothetical protein